jgi:hypothetical protein
VATVDRCPIRYSRKMLQQQTQKRVAMDFGEVCWTMCRKQPKLEMREGGLGPLVSGKGREGGEGNAFFFSN